MGSLSKSDIHISKSQIGKDRFLTKTTTNVVFAHKLRAGEKGIDLTNLNTPISEMPSFIQPTQKQLETASLLKNKNNLTVYSLSKGKLVQHADFKVTNDFYISFTSNFSQETDEVFECSVILAPTGDFAPATTKSVFRSYTLNIGQTILPIDFDYSVNVNPSSNIGSIRVFLDGSLVLRNTNNSSTTLDKTYYEPDYGGGGSANTIVFNSPYASAKTVVVDFGVRSVCDSDAESQIQYLSGSLLKIATDLSALSGNQITDYFYASASDIERRAFGDLVLSLADRVTTLEQNNIVEVFNSTISSPSVNAGYIHFKVPRDITFNRCILQVFNKSGVSSGSLTINIKNGATPDDAVMTSIFSSQPTINFATASDYATSNGTIATTTVLQNTFLRLDVTSVPAGWTGHFHISLSGI